MACAPRRSVALRPPTHRKRNWQVPGGRVTNTVGCAALPENPHARPIPAGAAARGQSHVGHTMLRCVKPPPDWRPAQVGDTRKASTGGHPAKEFRCTTALGTRASPCDSASRRPPPPNQIVEPWGGRPRIARGGGCPPGKNRAPPAPPATGPDNECCSISLLPIGN